MFAKVLISSTTQETNALPKMYKRQMTLRIIAVAENFITLIV